MNDNFDSFDEYVMAFDFNEFAIKRKYEHSYRVMRESDAIVYSLGLEEDDSYLACLIGLLHDIGRFIQWRDYHTYSDYKSVNHALLGAKILFDDGLIKKFKLEEKYYNLVRTAIENHGVYKLNEKQYDEQTLLHLKIIRDADKIDILYQLSNPKILELNEENNDDITEEIKEKFYKHESIEKKNVKNENDNTLMKIAMVYDLNYKYSKDAVLERGYLDRMLDSLKNKKLFKPYIEEAKKYLKGSDR
jgi:HD-GYP domain-containing protein (c-di-GMP phosphodiesterase class II)